MTAPDDGDHFGDPVQMDVPELVTLVADRAEEGVGLNARPLVRRRGAVGVVVVRETSPLQGRLLRDIDRLDLVLTMFFERTLFFGRRKAA
jgi:hypothetical protein